MADLDRQEIAGVSQPKLVHDIGIPSGNVGDRDLSVAEMPKDLFGDFTCSSDPVRTNRLQVDCGARS